MKKLMMGMSLAIAGLLFCGTATAQEEIDEAAEQIEQIAEELGERIEAWAEENSEELEAWAEKYSGQWEQWAEKFEYKMERWAEQQEGVWEEWAENYSQKWEDSGAKMESGELDPEEMSELIERNLEMLGDMPIGPMIEGLMDEGLGELKNAPWESLGELQDMLQGSLELSLEGLEDMAKEGGQLDILAGSSDDLNNALEKLKMGLDVKLKKLDDESISKLKELKILLSDSDLSDEQRDKIRKMAETIKDAKTRQMAELKEAGRAKMKARTVRKEKKGQDDKALEEFNKALKGQAKAKAVAKKVLAERDARAADMKKRLVEQAQKERETVKSKGSDIDALRAEIKKLRDEVERLKKDKDDD